MVIFGVILAPAFYRLVYAPVTAVRHELYVDAARVSGLSDVRIIGRHILSVVRAPIIIQTAIIASIAIAIQAGLEFLGLGDTSRPHLGSDAQRRLRQHLQGAAAHAVAVARDRADVHRARCCSPTRCATCSSAPSSVRRKRRRAVATAHRLGRRRHHVDRRGRPAPRRRRSTIVSSPTAKPIRAPTTTTGPPPAPARSC